MKYPIFAFAVGGMLVEMIHVLASGKTELAVALGLGVVALTVIGSLFEAVWNFK